MTRAGAPRALRDRWVVSYADLVTILLACFAATYAAQAQPASPTVATQPARRPAEQPVTPRITTPTLRDRVAPVVAANLSRQIEFVEDGRPGSLVIALPESASFATGSAELTAPATEFLAALANAVRGTDVGVRIEGHTDTVPVAGGRYASNWELSTARAGAVVAFLIAEGNLAPERLSAAGYAEFHPRVGNDSAEHRAINRRVNVVLTER